MTYLSQLLRSTKNKQPYVVLAFITALGCCLRVYHLDHPCFWYDELCTAGRVNGDMAFTLGTLKLSPFPPLYYILMNIWTGFFGFSEFSLRFPSMLFSILSVVCIYCLAKNMFGEKEGLLSALLLSVSAYSINYAQEAKMYAMFWCLGILSFMYFFLYVNGHIRKHLILYGIFSVAAIYTSYLALIIIFVQNLLFFLFYRKNTKSWVVANVLTGLSYIPWGYFAFYNSSIKAGIKWVPDRDYSLFIQDLFRKITGTWIGKPAPGETWVLMGLVIIAFIYAIYITTPKKHVDRAMNYPALFAWPVFYLLVFFILDIVYSNSLGIRYIGFIHIPVIIIFTVGISVCYRLRLQWAGILAAIFITISTMYFHALPFHQLGHKISGVPWKEIISNICEAGSEKSLLIVEHTHKDMMQYYGKCFKGDFVRVPLHKKITKEYIIKNKLLNKGYDMIFIVYRGDRTQKTEWMIKHQADEIRKWRFGIIRIPLPLKTTDS